jgi:hypothetical protein
MIFVQTNVTAWKAAFQSSGLGMFNLRTRDHHTQQPGEPKVKKDECPSKDCPEAITMCGVCVTDQAPGNIMLGVFWGLNDAIAAGAADAWWKSESDAADQVWYKIGDRLRNFTHDNKLRIMKRASRYSGVSFEWKTDAFDRLRDELCAAFLDELRHSEVEIRGCWPCRHAL